jgi:iron complex outermembrane receptor protein
MEFYKTVFVATSLLSAGVGSFVPAVVRAADSLEINEIVVTARRTEERLQDVPISITVFNQQQLDDRNVKNATDLATYTPSLTANTRYGQNSATYSIRGFFQELRTTASVATYFADVVAPRAPGAVSSAGDGGGPGAFFDLQNVQVLKGPQGTLFGRNTTGGAILLVPQKPTSDLGGYIEASGGNYDMRRAQGVVNIPFSDTVRFRAGFDWQQRDGYQNNVSGIGPKDFNDVDYLAGRASLVWDIAANLENYTIASYAKSDTNGQGSHLVSCPAPVASSAAFAPFCTAQRAREAGGDVNTISNNLSDPHQESRIWSVINTTTWAASDNLTVKNILGYAQVTADDDINPYGTDFRYTGNEFFPGSTAAVAGRGWSYGEVRSLPGGHTSDQGTLSEEFQLQGAGFDHRLKWQAGAYYENSRPLSPIGSFGPQGGIVCTNIDAFQCRDPLGPIFRSPIPAQYQIQKTEYTNKALYSQGTFDFTDKLSLTAGLRYTWDETTSDVKKYLVYFPTPNNPAVACESPIPGSSPAPGVYPLTTADIGTGACAEHLSKDSSAPTWTIGLDYKPVDDLLLYGKYSRGYRQGSTSPLSISGGAGGASLSTYDPEHVDVYEVGEKFSWQSVAPGYLNLSVFYNDFKDQQILAQETPVGLNILPNIAIVNAGKSTIKGLELEAGIQPFSGLHLDLSYAYLDSEIKELNLPVTPPTILLTPTTSVGRPANFTPKNKAALSVRYDLPLAEDIGKVSLGAAYVYTGSQWMNQRWFAPGVAPALRALANVDLAPSYTLLNLNVNWSRVMGSPVDLSLFGTNVTNKEYVIRIDDNLDRGFVGETFGEPRMYGVKVRYNFGS